MKLDRLMGILTALLQSEKLTAPDLAERFEVSRRTINRDIDTLCMAGIPIITRQGAGGGISIAEGFKLDKSLLTASELGDLLSALRGFGSVSNQANIQRTLDKLGANSEAVISLPEPVVIDLASHYKSHLTEKVETLKQAILSKQLVEFDYFYSKGDDHRCIEPYLVVFKWTSWYIFGFCLDRQDWRMFKLNRLWNLLALNTQFAPREIPPERTDFGSHWKDEYKLIAVFHKSVKYQLIDSFGLNCYHETDKGLHFEFPYDNPDYILSWLLSFGDKVKVINPPELVQQIQAIAKNISNQYET